MKTPTENNFRVTHHYHHQKYRLVNPNLRYDKTYHQQYVGTPEKKKIEASTFHPHHSSKILFQNEDSHSKKKLGRDSSWYHYQSTGWSIPAENICGRDVMSTGLLSDVRAGTAVKFRNIYTKNGQISRCKILFARFYSEPRDDCISPGRSWLLDRWYPTAFRGASARRSATVTGPRTQQEVEKKFLPGSLSFSLIQNRNPHIGTCQDWVIKIQRFEDIWSLKTLT